MQNRRTSRRGPSGYARGARFQRASQTLMEYDYPGKIRELEHIIEHAFVLCHSGLIQLEHLPSDLRRHARTTPVAALSGMTLRASSTAMNCNVSLA
jgi:transcriptional regulator of acetoin/glycerol metabolism